MSKDALDSKFLYYLVKDRNIRNKAISRMVGTTGRQRVPNEFFHEELEIRLPPLPEQRKIAAILTTVDNAIEKTVSILNQTKKVKLGLMQRLLTNGIDHTKFKQTEIGEIPNEWTLLQLDVFGSKDEPVLRTGPFGSSLKSEHFTDFGIPVVNIFNLTEGGLDTESLFYVSQSKAEELTNYRLRHNHIVFSRVADIGRSAVIPKMADGWVMSSNLMRISVNSSIVLPEFFYYTLVYSPFVTKQLRKGVNNAGRDTVTSKTLKTLLFPIPSIKEQDKIISVLSALENRQIVEMELLAELNMVKNSLMQNLLTGNVRVKVDIEDEVTV